MTTPHEMIEEIMESGLYLNEREETFLNDIYNQESLTARQYDWLETIHAKAQKSGGWEDEE